MKFTVEVDDFYLDEESELAPALQKYVIRAVVTEIWDKIKSEVEKKITAEVKNSVGRELTTRINIYVDDIISKGTFKTAGSKEEVLIADYIKAQFERNSGWNSPYDQIKKIASDYGAEMKKRYDFFYANQIVTQMEKIGILKEEIFHKLIDVGK